MDQNTRERQRRQLPDAGSRYTHQQARERERDTWYPGRFWLAASLLAITVFPPPIAADEPLVVSLGRFADIRIAIEDSAPAEVVANTRTRVPARISAPLAAFHVNVGDTVSAGDAVARLECDDFEDRLEQAEGRLEELEARRALARTRLDRVRSLRDRGAVAVETLDEADAEVDALAASIRSQRAMTAEARRAVARCDIRAPFAGTVIARPASVGEWVQPGTVVVRLLDPEDLELRAHIPSTRVPDTGALDAAEFRVGERSYPVRLRRLVTEADPETRVREARLEFTGARPLAGTAGRLTWHRSRDAVPADLLVERDGELGIMVARDGRAQFHALPEAIRGRPAAVELAADDKLIIDGREAARPGARIRPGDDDAS